MFGQFQQTNLRIEVEASEIAIRRSLLEVAQLRQWMVPQRLSQEMPEELVTGLDFTTWTGPIAVQHTVAFVEPNALGLLLSQGIDGFHHWHWGEGWIQSSLEGISFLPLGLGHTAALLSLKRFLTQQPTKPLPLHSD